MSDSGSETALMGSPATPGGGSRDVSQLELIDSLALSDYLVRTVSVLLEDDQSSPRFAKNYKTLQQYLRENESSETIKRFIADVQAPVLFVERISSKETEEGEISANESDAGDGTDTVNYQISTNVHFTNARTMGVVFIKRGPVVEADKSIAQQLRVISLTDGSPYETLHSYISTAVAPYFKSYIRESGLGDNFRDGDKVAPSVEKKLVELEMGLLHLQQNIDIPDITLGAHPSIQNLVKKSYESGSGDNNNARRPKIADLGDKVEDSTFLNQLQSGVNRWIRDIQKVTNMDRDPSSGTSLQEITFWLNLERALLKLKEKRESPEVTLTLEALKHGKRFRAVVSFDSDTGLNPAIEKVSDYNVLMKDFPINDLLSATELDKIRYSIATIFNHLRKIRITRYPIQRCLRLVEAISRDLQVQMLKVLNTRRLMHISFDEFDKIMTSCFDIFGSWDDESDKLQVLLRDLMKNKRAEQMKMVWRISPAHKKLQSRLEQMRKFRRLHEQLRTVIGRVLGASHSISVTPRQQQQQNGAQNGDKPGNGGAFALLSDSSDKDAIQEVTLSYENVKEVDCLDLSKEGTELWEAALKRYEERIDRVEARITTRLRDQLGAAKNANEMFRIFSRFNALFVRPHIRGAIREYQTQLIQRVKEDIEALHEKFKVQYSQSKCSAMSNVRDLPTVSGSIIWAKQIGRQLSLFLRRVEDVLGKGWENHIDGQKLKADGDSFRLKLNAQPMFDDWCAKVQARSLGVTGRIFAVDTVRRRQDGKPVLKLRVNFLPEIITLAKEVRNLKNMSFRVPLPIVNKALQANTLYPFAISLIESVHTYDSINERIQEKSGGIGLLIAGMKKEIQNLISEGVHLVWESYKLDGYVQRFSETVNLFQEKVEELLNIEEQIQTQLKSLDTCQYSPAMFEQIISSVQKSVDSLSLHQYSNLVVWVQQLDEEIEKRLSYRLQEGIKAWTNVLEGKREEDDMDSTTDTIDMTKSRVGGEPVIPQMIHEMRLTQQVMYLSPSIEAARQNLLQQLFSWEAVITTQTRISSNRYQVGFERTTTGSNYRNLLAKLPGGQTILEQAYSSVENLINKVKSYVGEWLRYQALWDLQPEALYERLSNDTGKWIKTLVEIKKARATFDTSETRKEFLPIIVDYAKVQSKVSLKYDSWHKDVLQKFGSQLAADMQEFYRSVKKDRSQLEQQSVDAASTSEAVGFITYIQALKRQMKTMETQVETYKEGQRILERQRFQFPNNWLHSDQIDGEWSAFNDILHRKDSAIQTQVGTLQSKIRQEDGVVETRTVEMLNEWEKQKPVEGTFRPENVLQALALFESKLNRLKDDRDNVLKAKEALELSDPAHLAGQQGGAERLRVALEELHDLKSVWQSLKPLHDDLDEMREKPWLSVQPKKLRQQLDTLMNQLKDLPANFRSYNAYEQTKKMLQNYAKVNILILELKSEALKERHWKQLMKQLRVEWVLNDLSLGQVWDANLQRYESVIKDTLLVAQGELALEEFLKQVRESWQNYELDLILYQNKTKLIRGWDDLFNKLKEHINSIHAMKLSPYYKEFEEDALGWEDKLNRITSLFDVWIDVQRRWVYLDGIFSGSADIKTLLPMETSKFQSICSEFLTLMKKVAASPRVLEIVNVQGIQRQLERLADLLTKIQKALGEYLERERAAFPRFYFVGDEDLLEIIGNSKNIPRLQKHFKKMFSGVSAVLLNEDSSICYGVASREGEEVKFINAVSIKDNPRVNAWLSMVENEIRNTLAIMLSQSLQELQQFRAKGAKDSKAYSEWLDKYPAQIVVLAAQISWSEEIEHLLNQNNPDLSQALKNVESMLNLLADSVLQEQPALRRKKLEHLITEFVHKRDVNRLLIERKIQNSKSFEWLKQMRFYFDPNQADVLKKLTINMANARFYYGFEYLGAQDKLVQTPLTDRCYLTMTQALEARLGGSPFGPAGTGKTESVKALGNQLGRFVLVFNCDETFDFQAMGRIFVGLCQVGAWGCFDEFNRLEERMLSAVSQQIQAIQETLRSMASKGESASVELIGKQVRVHPDMAIFITMNPGYAGRSNLPDNLKQLFRSLAMTSPDRQLIAQVMLFSQGFRSAEKLASKIVPFFTLCNEQLSNQSHYDFGLRALKYVLVSAGNVKRERIQKLKEEKLIRGEEVDEATIAENLPEQEILIQSVRETMEPKLVAEDKPLLDSLLSDVFPGVPYEKAEMRKLRDEIKRVCDEQFLCYSEIDGDLGYKWAEKVIQLYQITQLNHGLMMVGPSGTGKSKAWRVLLQALKRVNNVEGVAHVIDPKAMSKDSLYGTLDPNTREWTDGLFTHCLRKIIDNVRGEINKIQWIIFDGDVDPEWVENLNSVLDDNKLLTLPNGERLALPNNVRIMFEVQDLKYATLATVSRCGMVWFSDDVVTVEMCFENYFQRSRHVSLDAAEASTFMGSGSGSSGVGISSMTTTTGTVGSTSLSSSKMMTSSITSSATSAMMSMTPTADSIKDDVLSPNLQVQRDVCQILQQHFTPEGLVVRCLQFAEEKVEHVMDFTKFRALNCLFSSLNEMTREIQNYNQQHIDFPMRYDQMERYVTKAMISSIIWSFTGDSKLKARQDMSEFIRSITTLSLPAQENLPIIDFEVTFDGEWQPWQAKVPQIEVETHKVAAPDVVVPTLDTVRHERLLYTWLAEHKPIVLCGPPGSGKTMTLFSSLRSLPDMEVVGLNFSSATTPELLMKTFDHYCEYKRTPNGVVLAPSQLGRWIILFCDEINLPDTDKYGTQRVISFLRQLVEHGGFYRTTDQTWVTLERIQFVGACNPPTDPGRKPLSHRFLRHVPVIYVDYPAELSLKQIYGTFNRAMLRMVAPLRSYADPLTAAMVEFYLMSQERFTQDQQPHYVYSPRELTRWVRGICEAIRPLDTLSAEGLVRLWAHEALRLFQDRLITDEERKWTDQNINAIAVKHFPNVDCNAALQRPILYSCWLTKDYLPVSREELRDYVKARLKVFYEEELDVPLVLFDEVLDHVLRIDRIFRQPQGHLLLIGVSGSGKTTLSRFVAWMNGLSVFQIKVHSKYSAADFDEDLRNVLRRSGCRDEKICFIMDESNVLDSGFLERMNTLLANGEVPGLFEGDEFTTLMTQIKEGSQREGLMLDSVDELYKWFTQQVMRNLHVVFTMNPSSEGLKDRASTSPALFNRCVLNWFGDWTDGALFRVGRELTNAMDIESAQFRPPDYFPYTCDSVPKPPQYRDAVVNAFVHVHQTLRIANAKLSKRGHRTTTVTPRHYLDFINHYLKLYHEKRAELEEQQLHLNVGLNKIRETEEQVKELQKSLSLKSRELESKNNAANAKLKQMLQDQQEAEKKKHVSEEIQAQLQIQLEIVAKKQADVKKELEQVEPAVLDAQNAVRSIKKQHLVEVRSMANPPMAVKMALESICLLLGENANDWKIIRGVIVKDDFITRIVNFDTDGLTDDIREKMKTRYFDNPEYNYEKVNRASQACGPMVKWAIAQINFADMLHKVEPLRNELKKLERDASDNKKRGDEVNAVIIQLEKSIAAYKEEYALLISQAQAIKADLAAVQGKVDRSIRLLTNLSSERKRWEQSSETFRAQMETIVGDVLLSAAFLAYAGYFDQQMRQALYSNWSHHLEMCGIQHRPDMARLEYLSNPDDRLRWQKNQLPSDDLCTENAIMLKRFNRFPLIIDPSGQAIDYLMNELKDKKITKTSFLDDSFRKNLESALRFGNPLLVQDVESYDPILNPVLNRELKRTGGRVLITLGDQDIDLSPSFQIFLSTRDPTIEFAPDVCSRVTFVNFTVTRGSLQSQCLNQVLKSERPDIDQKRSDLMKLQGEFALKLRHLEKSLLQALNDAKGKILDDDHVITTLETLKQEAAEVTKKAAETELIMQEVEKTSAQYTPLSISCASLYFTLEQMNQIHFLYQYSLQFFMEIFTSVLSDNPNLTGVTDYGQRLSIITKDIFQTTYDRVARGMLHEDRMTCAILLARIYLKGSLTESSYDQEFNHLLRGVDTLGVGVGDNNKNNAAIGFSKNLQTLLTKEQSDGLLKLSGLPPFAQLLEKLDGNVQDLKQYLVDQHPEHLSTLKVWESKEALSPTGESVYRLLLIHALRPDRFLAAAHRFVTAVFGENFTNQSEKVLDLQNIIEKEIKSGTPVLLCSVPGYDASGRIDDLSAELGKGLTSVAIGSAEGFAQADKAINSSSKSGRWVMLKNVHLAPQWLVQLEKKLHSLAPHPQFRLFLTMEIHPKLPFNLLRAGRIFVYEPPPGIKANLLRTFSTIPSQRMSKAPAERARLYFVLAWLHALVQERLRYAPLGWSKKYEFSEADLRVACDTLDTCVESTAMGRANLPPEKVPWDALKTLLSQCIYGGRIDNNFDQILLDCFIEKLFTAKSFDPDRVLVKNIDGKGKNLVVPDGLRREQFVQWVESIQELQSPDWLGLPNNAETLLLTTRGQGTIGKLLKMTDDDDELAYTSSTTATTGDVMTSSAVVADSRPLWMKQLFDACTLWLKLLPPSLTILRRTIENMRHPLYRFFEREVNFGSRLLADVRHDLSDLVLICQNQKKQTNHHRSLCTNLNKGMVPDNWRKYAIPPGTTVIQWVQDFSERVKQLQDISNAFVKEQSKAFKNMRVWLGGLFTPEAYITATRQFVAQSNAWSLEELLLEVHVAQSFDKLNFDECSFGVTGLTMMGAKCKDDSRLNLCDDIWTNLKAVQLKWVHHPTAVKGQGGPVKGQNVISLPVYLHSTRQHLLFTLDFKTNDQLKPEDFYERGVAIICSSQLN